MLRNLMLLLLLATCALTTAACSSRSISSSPSQIMAQEGSASTAAPNQSAVSPSPKTQSLVMPGPLKENRDGIVPVSIEIPAIGVQASSEKVGRLDNGQMGVPSDINDVGWFEPGVKPGERGNAVIAGHVDGLKGPAVFYKLHKLKKGDEIIVKGEGDKSLTFVVDSVESYPRKEAPLEDIFGYSYQSRLNLITCTGEFNREAKTHEERLVVYSELKE